MTTNFIRDNIAIPGPKEQWDRVSTELQQPDQYMDSAEYNLIRQALNDTRDWILTGLTPGSYTNTNIDVDADGRIIGLTTGSTGAIANGSVTNILLADMPANTIKLNNTGGPAAPIDGTPSQLLAMLSLAAIATSGSASDLSAGSVPAARMPALTGDITSTVGTVATALAAHVVANTKLAQMPAHTYKGNNTGSTADAADVSAADLRTDLGLAAIATSGSASDLSAGTVSAARMPALTGDITTSAGAVATTLAAHIVTYAKQVQSPAFTIPGNNTGSTADKTDLSIDQVRTLFNVRPDDLGDGSDGSPVFDGTNTFASYATKSGSVYTLIRSVFWDTPVINAAVTIKSDGWPIRSKVAIDNSGLIDCSGGNASGTSDGTAAVTGSRILAVSLSSGNASGTAPQVFVANSAANGGASVGGAGTTGANGTDGTAGRGGGGGAGGNNNPFTAQGAAGDNAPSVTLAADSGGDVRTHQALVTSRNIGGTLFTLGTWGGKGGAGGAGTTGGGRGAAGGWIAIVAPGITGNGTITVAGGNGGQGTAGGAGIGGAGGGGGGAGGILGLLLSGGTCTNTINVAGGSFGGGGAGGSGSAGNGGHGGNGGTGVLIQL